MAAHRKNIRSAAILIGMDDFEFAAKSLMTDLRCLRCTSKSWETASFDPIFLRYTDCDQCCEQDQITKLWIPIQDA